MPARTCAHCQTARALILRPKDHTPLCKPCFISIFELEIHQTITSHRLFSPAEHIAIGASGGKDSTVLASVLCTLNARHNYGLRLHLLSIDEGITGYRDHSLDAVRRQAARLELPLTIVGYKELYGWSMDEVVKETGRKGNCTYCGVFRRQALDRGAASLGIRHVVTGHNADDIAETVVMNLLRGDLPRLSRATRIVTGTGGAGEVKRSKPLKYAYEKEIVLYAHHMKLEYFSTECIYSPEAFRGSARALIKNLERIRPSSILDVVRSGEDMAKLVPAEVNGSGVSSDVRVDSTRRRKFEAEQDEDEETGGCGTGPTGRSSGGEMADMEKKLAQNEEAVEEELEFEVTQEAKQFDKARHQASEQLVSQKIAMQKTGPERTARRLPTQTMGRCARCGYLSSQSVCKACALLEGLNKNRPKTGIEVGDNSLVHGVQLDDSLNRRLGAIGISIQPDKNIVPG